MRVLPPRNDPWNFTFLATAFFFGLVFQFAGLLAHTRCPAWPYVTMCVIFDVLILLRAGPAFITREVGRGWLFYAALCVLFVPLAGLISIAVHMIAG